MQRAGRAFEYLLQPVIGGGIGVVAVEVAHLRAQPVKCGLIDPAIVLDARSRTFLQLLQRPTGPRYADDRHVHRPLLDQRL